MYILQPEKKSRTFVNLLAIIGGLVLVLLAIGVFAFILPLFSVGQASTNQASSSQALAVRNEVVYKIRFDNGGNPRIVPCGRFDITYTVPGGTAQKEVEACKGITEVARLTGTPGAQLYLSIQNTWPPSDVARFSCIIEVDGMTVAEVESVGAPNIASCNQ